MVKILKNKYFILAILSIVFLFARLLVMSSGIHKTFNFDELSIGTMAKEMIAGPVIPITDYQFNVPHRGGRLVAVILTAPFFALFGPSYFVLKFVAILFSLGILVLTYLFLWKFFGRIVAVTAALIMIFSPALYTKFSLLLLGAHYESIFFALAAIFIFYEIFFLEKSSSSESCSQMDIYTGKNIYFAALGIVSGLGIYFHFFFAVTFTACFLFWFIFDKLFFIRKSFLIFLIFFGIGLTPWIYYNLTHDFASLKIIYSAHFLRGTLFLNPHRITLDNFKNLLIYNLPNSFSPDGSIGNMVSYAYYAVFVISYGVLFWLNRSIIARLALGIIPSKKLHMMPSHIQREAFLLLYPLVFILLYTLAGDTIEKGMIDYREYKRLILLYPFIFIIISLFLRRLWCFRIRCGWVMAAIFFIVLSVPITAGMAGNYSVGGTSSFSNCLSYEGYAYDLAGNAIWQLYGGNPEKAFKLAHEFKRPDRSFVFDGIGWGIGWRFFHDKYYRNINECGELIGMADKRYRPHVSFGFGAFTMRYNRDIFRTIAFIDQMDEKYRPELYRGVGWFCGLGFRENINKSTATINRVSEKYRSECYRGLGTAVGRIFGDISCCVRLLSQIPSEYQCAAYEGLGEYLGWRYRYFLKKDPHVLVKEIPQEYQTCFSRGLYALE
jgi:4-amino-4-deoxy-L-arabinose transferase-like glycosyltransferase